MYFVPLKIKVFDMNMERNRQDAEDYERNGRDNPADKHLWVCGLCGTKNMKSNNNCYNCESQQR